jgi:Na+-transporting NADH:ubiquinone oxidoreductase subunit A
MSIESKPLKPVSLRSGIRFAASGAPSREIDRTKRIAAAALLGVDYPGMRPRFQVDVGAKVDEGDTLFIDRKDEAIRFVAPLSGDIISMDYGPRRTLSAVVIRANTKEAEAVDTTSADVPDDSTAQAVRSALLLRGHWPAFRARPLGLIPASTETPKAIFVSAIDLAPGAVDPDPIIAADQEAFERGLKALAKLADGLVYVCLPKESSVRVPEGVALRVARFEGSYLAGLASTHIHRLSPASFKAPVWTIGFQDLIAIGRLFLTGRYDGRRVVALTGNRLNRPRLVEARLGARLRDLLDGEQTAATNGRLQTRTLSGSSVSGREIGFLGRYDTQVSLLSGRQHRQRPAWADRLPFFGSNNASPLVPNNAMDQALPANVLAVPMMRALSVGDAQAAKRLGALDLVEEDVAALNHVCTSGADYRQLLRNVLAELAEDAA